MSSVKVCVSLWQGWIDCELNSQGHEDSSVELLYVSISDKIEDATIAIDETKILESLEIEGTI